MLSPCSAPLRFVAFECLRLEGVARTSAGLVGDVARFGRSAPVSSVSTLSPLNLRATRVVNRAN